METLTELKQFVNNPYFQEQRDKSLKKISLDIIDRPIVNLIDQFNKLPYCFTIQSCYGHFLHSNNKDRNNLESLPANGVIGSIEYRIAYIAFCIDHTDLGMDIFDAFKKIPLIDPQNIQFCCAEWFWERQVNSFVLQVEPDRFKHKDKAILELEEAKQIEAIRNLFFDKVKKTIEKRS